MVAPENWGVDSDFLSVRMLIEPSFLESSKQADALLNCASELSRFRGLREDICHRECLARLPGTQVVSGDASDQILRD